MSIKSLSDYTFYSRYSQYIPEKKRRENWNEAVERVFKMHRTFLADKMSDELAKEIDFAEKQQKKKRVLASQRSLQFAVEPILKHNLKIYNCLTTYIDRPRVFQEMMFALLCGCGAGFSVQKHHVKELPKIQKRNDKHENVFVIEDSIEGWADAVGALMASYWKSGSFEEFKEYQNRIIAFDFSQIRPEGALIANRYKAPGPLGLRKSLQKIETVIERRLDSEGFKKDEFAGKLRPIDAYDIIMHISDAVLSGGVRRSATLSLFSHDDEEMIRSKTGNWHKENPQRGRSNNSAALLKGKVTKEEFSRLMESTKEFGEPGFIWVDDLEIVYNPCVEIAMRPRTRSGVSGWSACNLTEINGKYCKTKEDFIQACRASAIIGTLQAAYTKLTYFTDASIEIFEDEALLGCSVTGWMDNPEVLFDPETQREGAKAILETNEKIAKLIGINKAARTTCVKPAGSTSCVLGTASGIHPHHARRYIRRTQVNRAEFCGQVFEKINPLAVEKSIWNANGTDNMISFLCEVPPGAITKNQLPAVELLEKVKLTQQNWVEYGTRPKRSFIKEMRHNVSNTINVQPHEWQEVEDYIFDNQKFFAGISLLSATGDLDYPQAPFTTVLTPNEIIKEYGDGAVLGSGLVVDGLAAFDDNLWNACSAALGYGEKLEEIDEPQYPKQRSYKQLAEYFEQCQHFAKTDWIRRVKQFAARYMDNDLKRTTHCLKHLAIWKDWCDLSREYKEINWTDHQEERQEFVNADTLASAACAGGKCEI